MPARSKKLEKTPQIQLLRMLPVKLDTFGRNTASVNSFAADDTSTRVAVLNCLIGTFQVELPFEVVTLVDDRALLFPQLASAVHDRLDKIIRPRVVEMSDAALVQAIEEATYSRALRRRRRRMLAPAGAAGDGHGVRARWNDQAAGGVTGCSQRSTGGRDFGCEWGMTRENER